MSASVLIVDPEPFFCEALSHALNGSSMRVVGWTSDEHRATELVATRSPDLILTELLLHNGSGLSLARRVGGTLTTVVLTRLPEGAALVDAVAAGADGCVSHAIGLQRLRSLLSSIEPGRFIVDPDRLGPALREVVATRGADVQRQGADKLTLREREVLRLVADGLGNEEIASILYISTNTARTHVARILKKLGAHSRAEATRIYLKSADGETTSRVLHIRGPDLGRG